MAEREAEPRHLILFDGDCGFCQRAVRFISEFVTDPIFRLAPLDSAEGTRAVAGGTVDVGAFGTLLVVPAGLPKDVAPLQKGAAVLFIIRRLDWPWRLLAVIDFLPSPLLDWTYDQVARHRFLLSGGSEACALPTQTERDAD